MPEMSKVPFLDLHSQIAPLRDEIDAAMRRVIDTCSFVLGEDVRAFEAEWARFCGTRFALGVDNGTQALHLVLRGLGLGPGDDVLVPANSFIATAEAVSLCGARPVCADVDEATHLLTAPTARAALTPRTRAIVAVHLYGRTCDLEPLLALCGEHGLHLVEDAAQAHGARYHGRRVGSFGVAAGWSFYPGKNLGAFGDGGAITTDDERLFATLAELRDHGQARKYDHRRIGTNARLDSLQAAVLRVKLRHLDAWNAARRRVSEAYDELLRDSEFRTPAPLRPGEDHVHHLYVVRHPHRSAVAQALQEHGIGFGMHYPVPIHRTAAYAAPGGSARSLPVAERMAEEILSLPMYAEMTTSQVEHVCEVLTRASFVSG
jgi:dTDP-4-amino-4,6-dideoxygalactose transaminase